jgi:hypothetical protein
MSATTANSFETQIFETLNRCIDKISKKLDASFNPEDPKSLSLFRQFCSALNARRNWLKNFIQDFQKAVTLIGKHNESVKSQKSNTFTMANSNSSDYQKKSKRTVNTSQQNSPIHNRQPRKN